MPDDVLRRAVPDDLVAGMAHIGLDVALAGRRPTTVVRHVSRDGPTGEPAAVPVP